MLGKDHMFYQRKKGKDDMSRGMISNDIESRIYTMI